MDKIRTRFAPSPTGYLHIGSLRTALYAYLFAKKNNGDFLLRIEDTDQKRFVEGSVEKLIETLTWAGLQYDEGPVKETQEKSVPSQNYQGINEIGDFGPYFQSERLDIYKKYALELVEKGLAYYCFCSAERLEKLREQQTAEKKPTRYDGYCWENKLSQQEVQEKIKNGEKYVIRMRVPQNETIIAEDIVRGKVSFDSNGIDDQVLLKSDGFATYHLANVVDDHLMQISHVIRGDEWFPSLPKHLLLYRFFGWQPPQFAHLSLLLNADKSKLSKRQGDVAVEDYIAKGYLPEALVNFSALLGWNPGSGNNQEIFSLEELIQNFDLYKVHKAGAIFDLKKLDWMNNQYIRRKNPQELLSLCRKYLKDFCQKNNFIENEELFLKIVIIEKERMRKLSEIVESAEYYFSLPKYETTLLFWKEMTSAMIKENLKKAQNILKELNEDFSLEEIKDIFLKAGGEKRGEFLWPVRSALTGKEKSPSPFEMAWALGKEESLKRIKIAIEKLD